MKYIIILFLFLSSCADDKMIEGKKVTAYGLFNEQTKHDTGYLYEVSAGSVITGVILCETIVFPVYIVGWDLYEPVKKKEWK